MQRITYRVKVSAQVARRRISYLLRPANRTLSTKSKIVPSAKVTRFAKSKKIAQVSSIALLSLPARSLTTMEVPVPAYDQVMLDKTLTIAAVPGDSTYFATDGFQHGFGYDLVRSYADELVVTIDLKAYATEETALAALKNGEADMALTTASTHLTNQLNLSLVNLSCGYDNSLNNNGLNPKVSWTFKDSSDLLSQTASSYLCDNIKINNTQKLAAFYNQKPLKDVIVKITFSRR